VLLLCMIWHMMLLQLLPRADAARGFENEGYVGVGSSDGLAHLAMNC
jgi:hypothetical protein